MKELRQAGDPRRLPNEIGEEVENRASTESVWLLRKIVDNLDREHFTLQEIKEEFDALTDKIQALDRDDLERGYGFKGGRKYGQSHIDYLVSQGFIKENADGSYRVTSIGISYMDRAAEEESGGEDFG